MSFAVLLLFGATLALEPGEVFSREETAIPASASGLTWIDGDDYYLVADSAPEEVGLYRATIRAGVVSNTLKIVSATCGARVPLEGCADLEAVAYDPLTKNVWAADEKMKSVAEYEPKSGRRLRACKVPAELLTHRKNRGLESLAISRDGKTMWTTTEEAIPADGPISSFATGTRVRLVRFVRRTAADDWTVVETRPYTTAKWTNANNCGGRGRRGVSDLALLPDGSLLVLERELSSPSEETGFMALLSARFTHQISRVTAQESACVLTMPVGADGTDLGNYEGLCLGPTLKDGRRLLLMLTDAGDGYTGQQLYPLAFPQAMLSTPRSNPLRQNGQSNKGNMR